MHVKMGCVTVTGFAEKSICLDSIWAPSSHYLAGNLPPMNLVLRIAIILTMLFSLVYIDSTIAPEYDFEHATGQVGSDVEVVFDDMAVPHIYADSNRTRCTHWAMCTPWSACGKWTY